MKHRVKKPTVETLTVNEHVSAWELARLAFLGIVISGVLSAVLVAILVRWG